MHHMKYLNFTLFFHVIFLLVGLHPLLVALHPFTGIDQVIHRWKAAVNTQLSRVDHFFILAMILKVFHLKFIQRSSWTSCYFHVELLWLFSFVIFSSIHQCYTNDIPFIETSFAIFVTFSDRSLELIATTKLDLAF